MHKTSEPHDPCASPALDWITEGLRRAAVLVREDSSPLPKTLPDPARGAASTPESAILPERGISPERLLKEMEGIVEGATNVGSPGWMGHMDPPPTWSSVLGAATAALLNNNLLVPEMSASLFRLEAEVTAALARELGLGVDAGGTFTAGGSLANLLALAVARNRWLADRRPAGMPRHEAIERLSIVTSEDAHVSLARAALLLGLSPEDAVVRVRTDARGRLDPGAVERRVREAARAGRRCFCLVATAGTTVLGAVDPLADLADVARPHDLWYHVDAAYGGVLAFSPPHRELVRGIERADSVTVNPQKWLAVAKVCALALFADRRVWLDAMASALPYALPTDDTLLGTAGQIEGTRHADVLKLWLTLRELGREGVRRRIEHSLRLARHLEREVRARPFLRLAAEPDTNIVVFGWDGDESDGRRTTELQRRILRESDVFLSLPEHRGRRWLRAVPLNPRTDVRTLDRMFETIDSFAREREVS